MKLVVARTPEHYLAAVELFKEYAAGLGIDLAFQHFDDELQTLPSMYGPPDGELWLVQHHDGYVGCTALRRRDAHTCELKRMYIQPAYRGRQLGRQLLETALAAATALGYHAIKLDSLRRLSAAVELYRRYGFEEIPPYNHNPEADVVYFERNLRC